MLLPFKSSRRFSVFSYRMSHGLLLLRSGKDNEHSSRIDLLILDVRAMEIRCWFEGFEIDQADREYLTAFQSNPAALVETGNMIYALNGIGWRGFIVGGLMSIREDDGDMMGPSGLIHDRL